MKLASLHVHCLSIWFLVLLTSPLVAQGTGASDTSPAGLSIGDWSSIREIYDAGRYQVVADDVTGSGGYLARNPGQDWSTYFDGRGFTTQPGHGAWSWGLQLQSFGFDGHASRVSGEASPCADGGRMEYPWTDTLTEWYVNDTRGLEHGYTLTERPGGAVGPLTFTLDVRGDLRARVFSDGTGVAFMDVREQAVLTYAGLTVFDSEGTIQQATFAGGGERLRIVIEEAGAKYPLTIDPIAQQVYLKASNAGFLDSFGNSVAVSGDLVVVGAWEESSMATGVDGNENDNSAFSAGAAYVFERIGGVWSQQAYLKASNTNNGDQFGNAVAIFGETVAVGAWQEDGSSTGVDGDQSSNSSHESGAVYVFERSAGVWAQQAYLKASNTDVGDGFGFSLALSSDLLVVGAFQESSNAPGVDGTQNNNSSPDSGAAYVFERIGGVWSQQAYLKASNPGAGDQFGSKVGISGETVVVTAPFEDSGAIGVGGNENDNSASSAGAAYVFERSLGVWSQQAYLKASNTNGGDQLGRAVAISGDVLVLGARWEDSDASGVNGDQTSNAATDSGAAYVFARNGGTWSQQAYLKASNPRNGHWFGDAVAISGETIVVGAQYEGSSVTGVNGNQSDTGAWASGAAYVFEGNAGAWSQRAYLKASNTDANDRFACSVALSDSLLVVGARLESSDATGINGNQASNNASYSGAAYLFELKAQVANYCGVSVPNSSGHSAHLSFSGSLDPLVNTFALHAEGLPLGQYGYFINSRGQDFVINPGSYSGYLCLGGTDSVGRHHASLQNSGATGRMDTTLDLQNFPTALGPVTIQAGETWNFQYWFRDQNPGSTSNFSDGLSVLFE